MKAKNVKNMKKVEIPTAVANCIFHRGQSKNSPHRLGGEGKLELVIGVDVEERGDGVLLGVGGGRGKIVVVIECNGLDYWFRVDLFSCLKSEFCFRYSSEISDRGSVSCDSTALVLENERSVI